MKIINKILVNHQDARAVGGIDIRKVNIRSVIDEVPLNEHRDDYYIMAILIKGSGEFLCDMELIKANGTSLFFVKPFQLHKSVRNSKNAEAYFLTVAPFLIPDPCAEQLRALETKKQHLKISPENITLLLKTLDLLFDSFSENNRYKTQIMKGVFEAFIYQFTAHYLKDKPDQLSQGTRTQVIYTEFRKLLNNNSFINPPAFFAKKLNITVSHLNDCVKAVTGFAVTHWLQQAMLLEAKRHLYFTNNDSKQIAYQLGFEDHTYFSRLFKKLTGDTPLFFRSRFRE